MTFKKNFCPSPWFHVKISNTGQFEYCRWKKAEPYKKITFYNSNYNTQLKEYFQNDLAELRQGFLEGKRPDSCEPCYTMEQYGKVSGRQRQLLKLGIDEDYFEKTLLSSHYKKDFDYSNEHAGVTERHPVDWQIDLGNLCNSNCVFCGPGSSSRLAQEFKTIGLIENLPPPNWSENIKHLDQFIECLTSIEDVRYIHFIGGETLITPAFNVILKELVKANRAANISIGFTTNLTVWRQDVVDLLDKFNEVNLGVSVETLTQVNEYVRFPSKLDVVKTNLDKWTKHAHLRNWLMQIRITPTCLSVHDLLTVFDYAWENQVNIESCNFLLQPEMLKMSVLPLEIRRKISNNFKTWLSKHSVSSTEKIINTRDLNKAHIQLVQDLESYVQYLDKAEDESYRLVDLIAYIKKLENQRKNSIIDYLPQYENLFRSFGY